jgi:prepilin-type N-terminal cleavage/methylation domain-containing protein
VARRRPGFTLVEVLLSTLVMAILATVAVPMIANFLDLRGSAAASQLKADLDYLRGAAVASNRRHRAVFDVTKNRTTLEAENAGGGWKPMTDPVTKAAYKVDYDELPHFQGVTLAAAVFGGAAELVFDTLGVPSAGGTATLLSGNRQYLVGVSATGDVTVTLPEN